MRRVAEAASFPMSFLSRSLWDPYGQMRESAFMDRKDLDKIYPTIKPKTTGGGFGYARAHYWGIMLLPNPAIRLPHERRRLNPKQARIITVYGASGYLGAEIVRELCEHPEVHKVRATTRYPTHIPKDSDLDRLLTKYPEKIELHECDVTDRIQVNVAANGADCLIFAVDYHAEYANNSHYDVFVNGVQNVSWSARCVRAERVIFCSGLDSTFASESNFVDMRSRGEDACSANFPDCSIMRFGPLYGKNYRYRGLGRFVYPACFPYTWVQPTWVTDAARAVVRCCRAKRAIRYKLDLGGPETVTHVDFARSFARFFDSRFVFPFYRGIGRFFAKLLPWICPNPWFDDNYLLTFELDQVNRSPALFDRVVTWDHIAYKPHTIQEAAAIDLHEATLAPLHELDVEFQKLEDVEKQALTQEELDMQKMGIYRGKAEPGFGKSDGLEAMAQEIYPGHQFCTRPLEGAKYPSTVKNPGPCAEH